MAKINIEHILPIFLIKFINKNWQIQFNTKKLETSIFWKPYVRFPSNKNHIHESIYMILKSVFIFLKIRTTLRPESVPLTSLQICKISLFCFCFVFLIMHHICMFVVLLLPGSGYYTFSIHRIIHTLQLFICDIFY